jgi:hypothetical protein
MRVKHKEIELVQEKRGTSSSSSSSSRGRSFNRNVSSHRYEPGFIEEVRIVQSLLVLTCLNTGNLHNKASERQQ